MVAVPFRQQRLAVVSFAVTLLAVVLYGILAPSYRAHMRVLVRRGRVDPLATPTPSLAMPFEHPEVTEEELNSELQLLGDDQILGQVARSSGLAGKKGWIEQLFGGPPEERLALAVKRMHRRLEIQALKKTNLIEVTYASSEPEQAATVLHCLAQAYLERHRQVRRPSGEFTFFEQQVQQSRAGLLSTEMQLMEFTRDQGVVSAAAERDTALQKLADIEADQGQTRVAISEAAQRLQVLGSQLDSFPARSTTLLRSADNPQLMEKLKSQLLELQLKRTELLSKFEPSYRLVKEVDQQIAETEATLTTENQTPLRDETTDRDPNHQWAQAELMRTQVGLVGLEARAAANMALQARYRLAAQRFGNEAIKQEELLHDLKAAEERYLLYVNKREEARIGDALDQGGILNVTLAEEPQVPALPARPAWMYGAMGLLLAGTVSTGLAFAADSLDPSFRTPEEVVSYLGARVLASLPERNG
jgi:uncharacterized protein involved in exopolysaccharide biosynthesis